jgi:hypothetical protein
MPRTEKFKVKVPSTPCGSNVIYPVALKAVHTVFLIQMVHLQPMDEEDGIRYHRELIDNKKIDVPERNV